MPTFLKAWPLLLTFLLSCSPTQESFRLSAGYISGVGCQFIDSAGALQKTPAHISYRNYQLNDEAHPNRLPWPAGEGGFQPWMAGEGADIYLVCANAPLPAHDLRIELFNLPDSTKRQQIVVDKFMMANLPVSLINTTAPYAKIFLVDKRSNRPVYQAAEGNLFFTYNLGRIDSLAYKVDLQQISVQTIALQNTPDSALINISAYLGERSRAYRQVALAASVAPAGEYKNTLQAMLDENWWHIAERPRTDGPWVSQPTIPDKDNPLAFLLRQETQTRQQ